MLGILYRGLGYFFLTEIENTDACVLALQADVLEPSPAIEGKYNCFTVTL